MDQTYYNKTADCLYCKRTLEVFIDEGDSGDLLKKTIYCEMQKKVLINDNISMFEKGL
jgi:hypothetical protein